ncbi:carbohydrate-binding family 9-like protein [Mucilaginibacter paludis]|uniref:Carbohydrate-binding domain-containing protein n=1 Tax=Mucilaginibacter paludis DSM 18603 TaxID=714943 RepID=H1Y5V9_9SPHI|nr:carbohydrate-binding family 9-like protein [Mucilaginibacter paludis]EHQ30381.1 hypothetical protein Mucpa_6325 [Mucilaginibacter paludis DSM 18603]
MIKKVNSYFVSPENDFQDIALMFNNAEKCQIDQLLWSNSGYFPGVEFNIAYTTDAILLKYFVKEKYAVARHTEVNDLVYKDSCVEFFLSFNNGRSYYNLEFNCIGTPYCAYGMDRHNRVELPVDVVKQIVLLNDIKKVEKQDYTEWEIALLIPFKVFVHDHITSLKGCECKANFYKCGEETPEPHYLSWNNIINSEPDFHLPQFFGTINFV